MEGGAESPSQGNSCRPLTRARDPNQNNTFRGNGSNGTLLIYDSLVLI